MDYVQLIEEYETEVVIKINTELYHKLLETIQQQKYPNDTNISHDFLRRVVPFFMNQFLNWSMKKNDDNLFIVSHTLQKLQASKKSKQQKFQLGDLKLIFNQRLSKNKNYQQIRQAWQQFLNSEEIIHCIQNNKKIQTYTKQQYVNAIFLLKNELQKPFPYSKLLSKYNKTDHLNQQTYFEEQTSEEVYNQEDNQYSTLNILS